MKTCRDCNRSLPITDFYVYKSGCHTGEVYSYCRICYRKRDIQRDMINPRGSVNSRKHKYGLTEVELDDMESGQNYLCGVCGIDMQGKYCVDHDHTCCPNKRSCCKCIRGLICHRCNLRIAILDDLILYEKALLWVGKLR